MSSFDATTDVLVVGSGAAAMIDGLHAAGNCSASVTGRTCPGPGSTIGPATM